MANKTNFRGYIYIFQSFLMWGVLAIYWKQLKHVGSWELLSSRIIWSFLLLIIFLSITRKSQLLKIWQNKKHRKALLSTALLIGTNWGVFIYAVNADKIVQASLGYYITPLVNMFLGITILKEKLTKIKIVALTIVATSVSYLTISAGQFPYISFILAFSFGFYGLLKKTTQVDALPSLAFETTTLLPLAAAYQGYLLINNNNSFFNNDIVTSSLLIGTGIITILPLYWFTKGAKLIDLTSVGFFQYLAPTMMLLIGVFIYNEPFEQKEIFAFISIWTAIGLYIFSLVRDNKKK
ncbi:EamA family transporter RarD [Labilibacter sediminis]|nr:EamA family transporter RarD [Labilibacter sediminis]